MGFYEDCNPSKADGRQTIARMAGFDGGQRAELDFESENVARTYPLVQQRASQRATKFWPDNVEAWAEQGVRDKWEISHVMAYDVEDVRRIYAVYWAKGYQEKVLELESRGGTMLRSTRRGETQAKIHVIKAQHHDESHLYEMELTDSEYLQKPVRAEILVTGDGDTELRESDDHA